MQDDETKTFQKGSELFKQIPNKGLSKSKLCDEIHSLSTLKSANEGRVSCESLMSLFSKSVRLTGLYTKKCVVWWKGAILHNTTIIRLQ